MKSEAILIRKKNSTDMSFEKICGICLQNFKKDEKLLYLPCKSGEYQRPELQIWKEISPSDEEIAEITGKHLFHSSCATEWTTHSRNNLFKTFTCPICRTPYRLSETTLKQHIEELDNGKIKPPYQIPTSPPIFYRLLNPIIDPLRDYWDMWYGLWIMARYG